MTDIKSPLTDDEATVLQIAAQGMTIGAIGRWAGAVESLLTRGLLKDMSGDKFNCVITDAGRSAMDGQEAEDDRALGKAVDRALGKAVDRMRETAIAQRSIQEMAEQCAQVLVKVAEASSVVTGDAKDIAAKNWSKLILDRALSLLR